MEHVVLEASDGGRAALSYYPQPPSGDAALLWLPGRNDAFFHPHVASLLRRHGIDLYVLSYRSMGVCRKLNLFDNPMHNSHVKSGSFSEYRADIKAALHHIKTKRMAYKRVLGYGHSSGAPALLDYVMANGDGDFSAFVFNSPFLDWGKVGGPIVKAILMYAPYILTKLHIWSDETELLGGGGPSAWALQLYSQYRFDPASRPLFVVPVTVGYVKGVNGVQKELRARSAKGLAITQKPFLVLTSMHDDVLHGDQMAVAAHAIGPSRVLVQLCHARHDVFVSADKSVVDASLQYLRTWLVAQGYKEQQQHPAAGGLSAAAASVAARPPIQAQLSVICDDHDDDADVQEPKAADDDDSDAATHEYAPTDLPPRRKSREQRAVSG